jgi:hypothetical protein
VVVPAGRSGLQDGDEERQEQRPQERPDEHRPGDAAARPGGTPRPSPGDAFGDPGLRAQQVVFADPLVASTTDRLEVPRVV